MARDSGLEEVVREYLADLPGLSGKAMFGSWCWLLDGSLLCCASQASWFGWGKATRRGRWPWPE